MYAETIDRAIESRSSDFESPENPVERSIQLLSEGYAEIHYVHHVHHKKKVIVKSCGVENLQGYNEVEVLTFSGVPNGNSFYLPSCHLRPVPDYTWEENQIAENQDMRKANDRLKRENESLKMSIATTSTSIATSATAIYDPATAARISQSSADSPDDLYDPRQVLERLPRPGPDVRMSAADGNGLWTERPEIVEEKPFPCTFCGKRYKTSGVLSSHRFTQHGGPNNTVKMKHCDKCQYDVPYNNFKHHQSKCAK
jgi:hypothetical protein